MRNLQKKFKKVGTFFLFEKKKVVDEYRMFPDLKNDSVVR